LYNAVLVDDHANIFGTIVPEVYTIFVIGLKYAAIEVPPGVRGRMSIIGPLIDEAEAAIVVDNAPYGFGCIGCARTNELSIFLLRNKGIPVLELTYPTDQDETYVMVNKINEFVDSLEQTDKEEE
jgi:putative methanogenesis marker protein 5